MHTTNAMRFMSYTYEHTHRVWDVDCEFMMVVGVSRDTNVLH